MVAQNIRAVEIHHFLGENGEKIEAHTEVGAILPVYTKFIGHGTLKITQGAREGFVPLTFDLPAKTLDDALAMYQPLLKQAADARAKDITTQSVRSRLAGG